MQPGSLRIEIKKSAVSMRAWLCAIIALCCVLLSSCAIVWNSTRAEVIQGFKAKREVFERIVNDRIRSGNITGTHLLELSGAAHIDVPERLRDVGIGEIYLSGRNVYFECAQEIMGVTPCGIAYITDTNDIDEWYRMEPIESDWYYYRIVS